MNNDKDRETPRFSANLETGTEATDDARLVLDSLRHRLERAITGVTNVEVWLSAPSDLLDGVSPRDAVIGGDPEQMEKAMRLVSEIESPGTS